MHLSDNNAKTPALVDFTTAKGAAPRTERANRSTVTEPDHRKKAETKS
jgi:hypothetical protein